MRNNKTKIIKKYIKQFIMLSNCKKIKFNKQKKYKIKEKYKPLKVLFNKKLQSNNHKQHNRQKFQPKILKKAQLRTSKKQMQCNFKQPINKIHNKTSK